MSTPEFSPVSETGAEQDYFTSHAVDLIKTVFPGAVEIAVPQAEETPETAATTTTTD
jgi:hypothetical protein